MTIKNRAIVIKQKIELYLKENPKIKLKIIDWVKAIVIFMIFVTFSSMLFAPYNRVFSFFLYLAIFMYLPFSLIYFAIAKDDNDRNTILKMWKLYFSIVSLMFVFTFSMENYVRKTKAEYYKTKLLYEIRTKESPKILKETFSNYEALTNKYIEYLEPEEAGKLFQEAMKQSNKKNKQKAYTIIYANLGAGIMAILTLFMVLWSLVSLSIFQSKEEAHIYRIRKFQEKIKIKKKNNGIY